MNTFDKIRALFGPRPLSCEAINRFLAEYLEGTIDPRTRARFEEHLHRCPNCDVYLDQYRTTIQLVKEDELPPPPPELAQRTLAFLREHWEKEQD